MGERAGRAKEVVTDEAVHEVLAGGVSSVDYLHIDWDGIRRTREVVVSPGRNNDVGILIHLASRYTMHTPANVRATLANTKGVLTYRGGPLQTQPVVYLIFWGGASWGTAGTPSSSAQLVKSYFQDLDSTIFSNILTQYTVSGSPNYAIANSARLGTGAAVAEALAEQPPGQAQDGTPIS